MDDEKSMTEKLTDALSKATDSVKSTIGNIVDTASNAAQHAMESNAKRMSGQTAAQLDSEQVAEGTNGQVYLPAVTDAVAVPVPLVAAPPLRKPRKARTQSRAGKTPPAPKHAVAKRSSKKTAKKTAKKPVTKSAPKKSPKKSGRKAKTSAGKTAAKKAARKSAKASKKSSKKAGKKSKR
jgi:hypothetical protein